MKLSLTVLSLALASGSIVVAAPALAQYGSSTAQPAAPKAAAAPANQYKPTVSNAARKEIFALQEAVNAKNTAAIPAALAAAQAKAKTKDDRFVIGQLQLKAALDAKSEPGMIAGLEAVLAADVLPADQAAELYSSLGQLNYNAKAYDKAAAALERMLQLNPNNAAGTIMLAETRFAQGRTAEAITMIQKAIAVKTAAGQKAEEAWYKRALALSYNAKMANAPLLAREWVVAYPSPKNWRDAIRIYQTTSQLDDAAMIDSMRLARATGALQGESDYFRYANTLVTRGFAGEAKAVLEEGFAANTISKSRATFSQLHTLATSRAQGDRATLAASATAARAAADAKKAMTIAEAYYGYGDYSQAADLLRLALTKTGVDKDLANLRLGMALAQSGDKAGATAALNAAGGAQAEVAKLWLAYLATKA